MAKLEVIVPSLECSLFFDSTPGKLVDHLLRKDIMKFSNARVSNKNFQDIHLSTPVNSLPTSDPIYFHQYGPTDQLCK